MLRSSSPLGTPGLSPHSRGKRGFVNGLQRHSRSIPAFTGETRRATALAVCSQVYPRIHGGNCRSSWRWGSRPGLSPHSRGKRDARGLQITVNRSIPAFTGETYGRLTQVWPHQVYPRIHGGNVGKITGALNEYGLSPHSRGKHVHGGVDVGDHRSIPAFTGETS